MSMTDSAKNVALCNQALGMLGSSDISVGGSSQNHTYCTTFFDDARDEILVAHKWNFAKKRAYALQTTDPLFGYDNAFTKPTDSLKVWKIEEANDAEFEVEGDLILTNEGTTPSDYDSDSVDYLAGEYLQYSDVTYLVDTAFTSSSWATDSSNLTTKTSDYDVIKVEYVYQVTDLDDWTVYAKQCFVINLARMLCSPIKQDEKVAMNLQGMLYGNSKTRGYLPIAKSIDAQEGGVVTITANTLLNSRT